MTRTELNKFRAILNLKTVELARELRRRDGIAIVRAPDALDEVQYAVDRDLTTRNLERGSIVMRNVNDALDRIADGTYGMCLECEGEITHKRLQAVPWASLCIACQEHTDRNREPGLIHEERLLRDAA